jgi:methionyl-tRNA synthetase
MKRLYITTPIYYVNGNPHIGHAHTSIMADILKRLAQLHGLETFMTTGTDEHGQKNQEAAVASGLPAQAYLDRQSARFRMLFERLDVGFDMWVRTSSPTHKKVVSHALQRLNDLGYIYKREYQGLYCVGCELFKKKTDLDELGRCPDHLLVPVEMNETNYFLKISQFQPWLIDQIENRPDWIQPDLFRREVLAMLRAPLDDLCLSRPKTRIWLGVEIPFDKDYVTYVWFDALLNYLSNIGWPGQSYLDWWPSVTHLMAKDIIKTHCIYWPIILKMLDAIPPHGYRVHGFWVGEGGAKMSKTLGNVVVPDEMIDLVGPDGLRFYLAKTMHGIDSPISRDLVVATYNADLANNLGNLYSRAVKFTRKYCSGCVPPLPTPPNSEDTAFGKRVAEMANSVFETANLEKLPSLVARVIEIANLLNGYFECLAPWTLVKDSTQIGRLHSGLYTTLDSIRILYELAYPVIPKTAARALRNLHAPIETDGPRIHQFVPGLLGSGVNLDEDTNLFPRIEV